MTPALENETGEILLSLYGAKFALGWRGDAAFMARMESLVFNFSMSQGRGYTFKNNLIVPKFNHVYDGFCYVLTTIEKLMAGLTVYYQGVVIRNGEYPEEAKKIIYDAEGDFVDIEWQDDILFDLAYDKAEQFYRENIKQENFMYGIESADSISFEMPSVGASPMKRNAPQYDPTHVG
jgi:hypothetical protein